MCIASGIFPKWDSEKSSGSVVDYLGHTVLVVSLTLWTIVVIDLTRGDSFTWEK